MTGIAFPGLAQTGVARAGVARQGEAGIGLGFVGGRVSVTPLRVIGTFEQALISFDNVGGTNRSATRQPLLIGQDGKSLVLSFSNWTLGTSGADSSNTNTVTVMEAALEKGDGSAYAPITFSGSNSLVMGLGDNDIHSDPILPSSLSLARFSRNEKYWIRLILSVPTLGDKIPYVQGSPGDESGGQAFWYDSAAQTRTAYSTGAWSTTGVSQRSNGYKPIVLGYPVVDRPSFFTTGDSISVGIGDGTANGSTGRGFVQRAMAGGTPAAPLQCFPNLNFGKSGVGVGIYLSSTRWKSYLPYAIHAIDQILTNDVPGRTTGQMQTDVQSLWTLLRAGGIKKIIRTELLLQTTSTDAWATTVNQTVASGWENGGKVPTMNTFFATSLAGALIDYYISGMRLAVADSVATDKWAVPQVNNFDQAHPNTTGATTLSAPLRSVITSL